MGKESFTKIIMEEVFIKCRVPDQFKRKVFENDRKLWLGPKSRVWWMLLDWSVCACPSIFTKPQNNEKFKVVTRSLLKEAMVPTHMLWDGMSEEEYQSYCFPQEEGDAMMTEYPDLMDVKSWNFFKLETYWPDGKAYMSTVSEENFAYEFAKKKLPLLVMFLESSAKHPNHLSAEGNVPKWFKAVKGTTDEYMNRIWWAHPKRKDSSKG